MLCRIVERMDRSRFESVVISLLPGGALREAIETAGIVVESVNMDSASSTGAAAVRLARALRRFRPTVLQTWLCHADLLGLAVGTMTGVPYIMWNLRSTKSCIRSPLLQRLHGVLSRYPKGVVVNSLRGRAMHEDAGYAPRAWHHIPNGFDTSYFRPMPECARAMRAQLHIPENALVVGMIARYHPNKDHGLFFSAAFPLTKSVSDAYFVLAGPDIVESNRDLMSLVDPAIRGRVRLIGPRSDIPELLSAFDIATMASGHIEGFPNVVGEAMSCGVPCVVTDSGDAGQIVASTGWCVPVSDIDALVGAWRAALEMPAEARRELGRQARQRIVDHFSLDRIVAQYEELYASTIAER
jgi:glycosyltransferase involved in cell wall biosynthesis